MGFVSASQRGFALLISVVDVVLYVYRLCVDFCSGSGEKNVCVLEEESHNC